MNAQFRIFTAAMAVALFGITSLATPALAKYVDNSGDLPGSDDGGLVPVLAVAGVVLAGVAIIWAMKSGDDNDEEVSVIPQRSDRGRWAQSSETPQRPVVAGPETPDTTLPASVGQAAASWTSPLRATDFTRVAWPQARS